MAKNTQSQVYKLDKQTFIDIENLSATLMPENLKYGKIEKNELIVSLFSGIIGGIANLFIGMFSVNETDGNIIYKFSKKSFEEFKDILFANNKLSDISVVKDIIGDKINFENSAVFLCEKKETIIKKSKELNLCGLFYSFLKQFVYKGENKIIILSDKTLLGYDFNSKIFSAFVNWCVNFCKSKEKGTVLDYFTSGIDIIDDFDPLYNYIISIFDNTIKQTALKTLPEIVTEGIITTFWFLKSKNKEISKLKTMLFWGNTTVCFMDLVKALIKNGGLNVFLLSDINSVVWGMLMCRIADRISETVKTEYSRYKLNNIYENICFPDFENRELKIGSNVVYIDKSEKCISECFDNIEVNENNPFYSSLNGVLYDKKQTKLLVYPSYKKDNTYKMPENLKEVSNFSNNFVKHLYINSVYEGNFTYDFNFIPILGFDTVYADSNPYFVSENGTLYRTENGVKYKVLFYSPLNKDTEYIIPETVEAVDFDIFNNDCLKSIYIGSSVRNIGFLCFAKNLEKITVSEENKFYSSFDGVLYDKKQTQMLIYPKNKKDRVYTMPKSLKRLANELFVSAEINNEYLEEINLSLDFEQADLNEHLNCKKLKKITVSEKNNYIYVKKNKIYSKNNDAHIQSENVIPFLDMNNENKSEIKYKSFLSDISGKKLKVSDKEKELEDKVFDTRLYKITEGINLTINTETADTDFFDKFEKLKEVSADKKNDNFSSAEGILYDKYKGKLIYYPTDLYKDEYIMPETIEDINECNIGKRYIKKMKLSSMLKNFNCNFFDNIESLEYIKVPMLNRWFSDKNGVLFDKNKKTLLYYPKSRIQKKYTVPESVTKINKYAFGENRCLSELHIGKNVSEIEDGALYNCSNLETVYFPEKINKIGGIFANCSELRKIVFYGCLKEIDPENFSEFEKLESINIIGDNSDIISHNGVLFSSSMKTLLFYPSSKRNISYTFPETVENIGENAFKNNRKLRKIVLPPSLKAIGHMAFCRCENLTDIKLENVQSIGMFAFEGCENLMTVKLKNAESIGIFAFEGCENIREFYISKNSCITDEYLYSTCNLNKNCIIKRY